MVDGPSGRRGGEREGEEGQEEAIESVKSDAAYSLWEL